MRESSNDKPTILIVDDEEAYVQLFSLWLPDLYHTITAQRGEEALDKIEKNHVDLVLLDRQMPGLSGDSVLEKIEEIDSDCQVIMVTAVEPEFDIVSMGFDEYIVKPVGPSELIDAIDRVLKRVEYSESIQEFTSLVSKKAALEATMSEETLEASEEYDSLIASLEEYRDQILQEGNLEKDIEFISILKRVTKGR